MLSVWRLQLLREVASRGTIKAAAEAMFLSASAVSQQLTILEREVGTPLLAKNGRRVRVTDAGTLLAHHANIITAAISAAEADLAVSLNRMAGNLRVASFPIAAQTLMPNIISAVSKVYPSLRVTLRNLESAEAVEALRRGQVDLAVVDDYPDGESDAGGVDARHMFDDPLYVASAPQSTDVGAIGPIGLAQLRDAYWITGAERGGFCRSVVKACQASGFEPQIRASSDDLGVVVSLVERGLGVAAVPALALYDRSIHATLRGTDPPLTRRVSACVRRDERNHPAVSLMLDELAAFGQSYTSPISTQDSTRCVRWKACWTHPCRPTRGARRCPPIRPARQRLANW